MNLALGITGALAAASCSPPSSALHHKDDMTQPFLAIDVHVTGDGTPALAVHCTAKNVSNQPVHVFDSARMPYLLDEQGTLSCSMACRRHRTIATSTGSDPDHARATAG